MINNSFRLNSKYGIFVHNGSHENIIYRNNIINNNQGYIQAKDNFTGNIWNVSGVGNYWSDLTLPDNDSNGIIDIPYFINGSANATDCYPLSIPIPKANAGVDVTINQNGSHTFDSSGCLYKEYIENYTWNFTYDNNKKSLYGPSPSFYFDIVGVYQVTLKVVNSFELGTSNTMSLVVRDATSPIAKSSEDIYIDQHEIALLDARNSTDNIGIVNYSWKFTCNGYDVNLYGETESFIFHIVGQYAIYLKVIDNEGNSDTDVLWVFVQDITPPNAEAGSTIIINQSETIEFFFHQNSTDNVGCWNWTWIFRYNNSNQSLFHAIHFSSLPLFTFDIPGFYTVTMNVTDEAGNWARDTLNITVLDDESPEAHTGENASIDANSTFIFNGSGSGDNTEIVNYTWTFEYDGKTITLYGPDPYFKFKIPGNYTVTLNVTDIQGNSAEDYLQITVNPRDGEIPPDDDTTPEEDSESREKKNQIYLWTGILIIVSIICIVSVVLNVLKKKKDGSVDQSSEDELGRVGKTEDKDDDTQSKNE